MSIQGPSIFNYTSPDQILRDFILLKKKDDEYFSVRKWSRILGFKSHSQLHQIVAGKKKLPKKYIPGICKSMKLSKREGEFFLTLAEVQSAKSIDEKDFYVNKLREFKKFSPFEFTEVDEFRLISDPVHYFILELITQKKRGVSVEEIKGGLLFDFSSFEIRKAIQNLVQLRIVEKTDAGYQRTKLHFYNTSKVPSEAIKNYHKNIAKLIPEVLDKQSLKEREFSGSTFNINTKDLESAKEDLRAFRQEFIQKYAASPEEAKRVYQLNLNFFAISNFDQESLI